MKNTKETIILLDGNSLLHRSYHAIPPLTTNEGLVVNAVYGFAMVTERILEEYKPKYMAVAWDLPSGTFRNEIDENYKAHREKKEQELYDQIPMIQEMLEKFNIPSIEAEGFEADDIIGTLSKNASKKDIFSLIVTGDLDALQLVSDDTHVLFFQKGVTQTKRYDIDAVKERYDLHPDQLIDFKSFKGDSSDNIAGVKGVGDKTATLLLHRHGDINDVFKALAKGEVEAKFAKKLDGQKENAMLAKRLVTIVRDIPLGFRFSSAVVEIDRGAVVQVYRDYEFKTLLRKYDTTKQTVPPPPLLKQKEKFEVAQYKKPEEFFSALKKQDKSLQSLHVMKKEEDLFGQGVAYIAAADTKSTAIISYPDDQTIQETFKILSESQVVVMHGAKQVMHMVKQTLSKNIFDIKIASYILHSGSRAHDLESIVHKNLEEQVAAPPAAISSEKDAQRAGRLTKQLLDLYPLLQESLEETKQLDICKQVELPLLHTLYEMEQEGILLDKESLGLFEKKLRKQIQKLEKRIIDLAGEAFNVNSPSQLAVILFERLELPTKRIKKTKKGYSTAASELEKLWDTHEIVPLIAEYREVAKLQSTYVETLPKLVKKDGRIHSSFNQTVAATGRLSSSEPNLQNIPIKTALGREIRKAFIAPKGKRLIAADYSQIELRLAAVIAKDQAFIKAFQEGADIHTRTAAEVWEVSEEDVTKDQRRAAKAINFGVLYGMGPRALARSTGLSFSEAKDFIRRYFEIHQPIQVYLNETKEFVRNEGYVETLFGRRRYLPEIESGVPMLIAQAERMAINMPIQGTAADIMKKAMLNVDGWLKTSNWPATMLLQVHDELVLEVEKDAVEPVAKGLQKIMEGVVEYEVPLSVNVEVGKNWGEMKEI